MDGPIHRAGPPAHARAQLPRARLAVFGLAAMVWASLGAWHWTRTNRCQPPAFLKKTGHVHELAKTVPLPTSPLGLQHLREPTHVVYRVQRGGTLANVANLFKIYHHEILALNEGRTLDEELPPGTAVTVYRKAPDDEPSESVGTPSQGSVEHSVPMQPGPGRIIKALPYKAWATADTVALLDGVLRTWANSPAHQPILIGNLSLRHGGKLAPHATHQSGRDVDLGYPQRLGADEPQWRDMNEASLDAKQTWALLQLLVSTGRVEVIYMDASIQNLLIAYGETHGLLNARTRQQWFGQRVEHRLGHTDHFHVRFTCHETHARCRSNDPASPTDAA